MRLPLVRCALRQVFNHCSAFGCQLWQELSSGSVDELSTLILILRIYIASLFSEVVSVFLETFKSLQMLSYLLQFNLLSYSTVYWPYFLCNVYFCWYCRSGHSAVVCPSNRLFIKDVGELLCKALCKATTFKQCSEGISPWRVQKWSVFLCGCSEVLHSSSLIPKHQWPLNCNLGVQSAELFLEQWQPVTVVLK